MEEKKSIKGYKTQDTISVSGSLWNADCWKLGKYTGKALPSACFLHISLDICCWLLAEIGWAGTTAARCSRSQCWGKNTRSWGPAQNPHFAEIFSPSVQASMGITKVKTPFVVASPQKQSVSALRVHSARHAHQQEAVAMSRPAAAEVY